MLRVGITTGLRGTFAVLYDEDGPIQSGIGSYKNASDPELKLEVCGWVTSENLDCSNCYYYETCDVYLKGIKQNG